MTRVARLNSVTKRLPYLLVIAVVTVSLTNATNRSSSRQTQDPNPYDVGQWELSFTASAPRCRTRLCYRTENFCIGPETLFLPRIVISGIA